MTHTYGSAITQQLRNLIMLLLPLIESNKKTPQSPGTRIKLTFLTVRGNYQTSQARTKSSD